MAWIELHQSLRTNPKVTRLAAKLGVTRAHATGLLANLWLWAVDHAWDGQLRKYSDLEIAEAAWWNVGPGRDEASFRLALRETGWEDSDGTLHDWKEYGVRLIDQARHRKRKWRKHQGKPALSDHLPMKRTSKERSESVPGTSKEQLPYRTLPTVPKDLKEASTDAVSAFTQHFTQALKTKTGVADPKLVKKAQGVVYAYLTQYPEAWQALTTEVDVLPRGWEPARYLAQVRVIVQQRTHEQLKAMTEGVAKG